MCIIFACICLIMSSWYCFWGEKVKWVLKCVFYGRFFTLRSSSPAVFCGITGVGVLLVS